MLLTGSEGGGGEGGGGEGRGRRGGGEREREESGKGGRRSSMNRKNCLGFFHFYEGRLNAFKVAAWLISQRFQFGCAINKVQSSEGHRQGGGRHAHKRREQQ